MIAQTVKKIIRYSKHRRMCNIFLPNIYEYNFIMGFAYSAQQFSWTGALIKGIETRHEEKFFKDNCVYTNFCALTKAIIA